MHETKAKLHLTLVCPTVEYASCARDPYTQHNISSLEKVQQRAARDYSRESSVFCMLFCLDWPLLSEHRECQWVNFMVKASENP